MKISIFGVMTLVCLAAGGTAAACPGGGDEGAIVRPPRPVVQNVSLQASELIERARVLESSANRQDGQARALEQEADTLSSRARMLRNQASFVNVADRSSLLASAEELAMRASIARARAAEDRARADNLRFEAQSLRQRALLLVRGNGGGGGWRKRSIGPAPVGVDRGLTL